MSRIPRKQLPPRYWVIANVFAAEAEKINVLRGMSTIQGGMARLDLLAPLDRVDIYTFLNHFPQRTHLPELVHCSDDPLDDEVDFRFGRETPDAEPQGTVRHVFCRT